MKTTSVFAQIPRVFLQHLIAVMPKTQQHPSCDEGAQLKFPWGNPAPYLAGLSSVYMTCLQGGTGPCPYPASGTAV